MNKLIAKIRHSWYKSYIRKDEFHKSLDIDIDLLVNLNKDEKKRYMKNLVKRRNIAYNKNI